MFVKIKRTYKRAFKFVKEVIQEFTHDRGPLFAAAISFFAILSLIPLILLAVGVFGIILGSFENALDRVINFAEDFIPVGADAIRAQLEGLIEQSGLISGIGLLALLWTGSQVFVILQQVMNVALGGETRVGFIRGRAMAFLMVFVVGLLFILSVGITSLITAIRNFDAEIFGIGPQDFQPLWDFLGVFLPIVISALAFSFAYKFLPKKDIGYAGPIIGGITAGVLFEIAKHAFSWYVGNIADFSRIYGSLGGAVILVLWIYYVSMIMVLGAEVASVYAKRHRHSR